MAAPTTKEFFTASALASKYNATLQRIQMSTNEIFQHTRDFNGMHVWEWPIDGNRDRIAPSALREHRKTHIFRGPSCLCPLKHPEIFPPFVEAAIYTPKTGAYAGEYIASCARDNCSYIVLLERVYNSPSLVIKAYKSRGDDATYPLPVLHHSEHGESFTTRRQPPKRTYALIDLNEASADDGGRLAKRRRRSSPLQLLLKLDDRQHPGLNLGEFRDLIGSIDVCFCGLIMTNRRAEAHQKECALIPRASV